MLSEYEYAQAVMKAAGVEPLSWTVDAGALKAGYGRFRTREEAEQRVADQTECSGRYGTPSICVGDYPDPLTSGDGFLTLWDALVTKDFLVRAIAWNTSAGIKCTFICIEGENWRADSDNEDIKAALVEAAGQVLGVSRG